MKPLEIKSQTRAFTLLELTIVLAMAVLLFSILSFNCSLWKVHTSRIKCVSNLKQIGLGFRIFANEHDELYPFAVPKLTNSHTGVLLTSNITTAKVWMHFQALSNELQSARVLFCPEDTNRWNNWADDFLDTNVSLSHPVKRDLAVSYFVGLRADETRASAFLSGDRHMSAVRNGRPYSSERAGGAVRVREESHWSDAWFPTLHGTTGNVTLADGSVQLTTTQKLQAQLALATNSYGTNINLFLFPQ